MRAISLCFRSLRHVTPLAYARQRDPDRLIAGREFEPALESLVAVIVAVYDLDEVPPSRMFRLPQQRCGLQRRRSRSLEASCGAPSSRAPFGKYL